jgi:hypothetical protein
VADVFEQKLTEREFVNKFLEADLHFILAHPHQGAKIKQLGWDMVKLGDNLQRLYHHVGFPRSEELLCPVFLQDKYEYLYALGEDANPTMRIFFNKNHDYSSLFEDIRRYVFGCVQDMRILKTKLLFPISGS